MRIGRAVLAVPALLLLVLLLATVPVEGDYFTEPWTDPSMDWENPRLPGYHGPRPSGASKAHMRELLHDIDMDGNSKIDFKELVAFARKHHDNKDHENVVLRYIHRDLGSKKHQGVHRDHKFEDIRARAKC